MMIIGCICFGACVSQVQSERLHFKQNGFSIAPLEEAAKNDTYQALMMYLPISENFAPNVNVQIKPFTGPVEDYVKQTKQLLEQNKLKLIKEGVLGKNAYVFEYSGSFNELSLHLYTRSVLSGGRVYIITATATETQWKTYSEKLKSCVDSFELDKGK
jgi:hypothetical protein